MKPKPDKFPTEIASKTAKARKRYVIASEQLANIRKAKGLAT